MSLLLCLLSFSDILLSHCNLLWGARFCNSEGVVENVKKLKVCSDRSSLVTGVCCQFKMWTIVKKKQPQLSPSTKKKVMPKCKLLLFCVHCLYVGHLTVVACFNLFLLFVCLSFV